MLHTLLRHARRHLRPLLALGALPGLLVLAAPSAQAAQWSEFDQRCVIRDDRVVENSGMARSTYRRPVMFLHNDSGGGAQFFAIGGKCRMTAVFDVPNAPHRDWEDMAVGPDHTLWFGDIGGNRPREVLDVIRVKEPKTLKSRNVKHRSFHLTYPDGAHNAEALLVRPRSGRIYVVTKADEGAIYRAPKKLSATGRNVMKRIADAPMKVTAGDFGKDGGFVLRGYNWLYIYSSMKDRKPTERLLPEDARRGGEALAFRRSGALVVGSEGKGRWVWHAKTR